jgi:two-component system chemotaxis response regulator CheB
MSRVKVLIIDDSPVAQYLLSRVITGDPRLEVAGIAGNADEALRLISVLPPDVVSMDIRLPGQNGLDLTRRIMREHPLPIVVVASDLDDRSLDISMNALKAGALSVVEKPLSSTNADWPELSQRLCSQLYIMSQVPVVQHRRFDTQQPVPGTGWGDDWSAVVMGASTGGPSALAQVLGALPGDFPLPLALVQHMGASFMEGFVAWLSSVSALPVGLAGDGGAFLPGHVAVAPAGVHIRIQGGRLCFDHGELVHGQRPSADILLASAAAAFGSRAIGVLLTGMGEDGARGLAAIRGAGGYTIAEDASSAVVWGMPGTAVRLGAAVEVLAVNRIARRLVELARGVVAGRREV